LPEILLLEGLHCFKLQGMPRHVFVILN
jgi:hypothetical protein